MGAGDLKFFVEWSVVALRGLGVAYILGGIAAGMASTARASAQQATEGRGSIAAPAPFDSDRRLWRVATALLTIACGAAMATRDEAAAPLLGALLVQQSLYLIRQFMAERAVARPEQKAQARVSALTVQAFVLTGMLAALASFLRGFGALG
ncbi:MAG: hypothetical protein KJS97_00920 [Alphaproteobacteria bacterium]|nr:hypothetical protein [Alphaproteobacteria bacterium]